MTDTDLFSPEVAAQLQHSDQQIIDGAAAASEELDLVINGGAHEMPMAQISSDGA